MFAKDASIKNRLTSMIMSASTISVLLTTLAISVIGVYNLKQDLLRDLTLTASIVGDRNTAALLFNDDTLAQNNMDVFSARRSVIYSCLYDTQGAVFATYYRNNQKAGNSCPENTVEHGVLNSEHAEVMRKITRYGDDIGYIFIQSDLLEISAYIRKQGTIALLVTFAVLIFSYLMAVRLQRSISGPVLSLAATAQEISQNKDYSIRARPFHKNSRKRSKEIMLLTESFNSMLTEIGERDHQLKQQNIQLEKARDDAEAANRAKSQFLANISHELRTPLNAIIGFSSIIMNQLFGKVGDPKYVEYAEDINQSGVNLLDVINDILDLAKAESGSLVLDFEEVHVPKAIKKCLMILGERAKTKNLELTSEVPISLPLLVADRVRLIQIVLNVLSNAIKFTPEGGKVSLTVSGREMQGEVTHLLLAIRDNGIGMSEEDIQKAYQSFGQVDSGLDRRYQGTGLGLPLTKKLLELHHGTIDIDSEPGQGTTVTLTLPVIPPAAEQA